MSRGLSRPVARLLLLGCVGVSGSVACEHCEVSARLYEPFKQAYSMPESFDSWLVQHPGYFTPAHFDCVDPSISRIDDYQAVAERSCDDAFTEGSDFWHACYDDADVLDGNMARAVAAIDSAARGAKRYDETEFGASAIAFKASDPALFGALFVTTFQDATIDKFYRDVLTCERCHKGIF